MIKGKLNKALLFASAIAVATTLSIAGAAPAEAATHIKYPSKFTFSQARIDNNDGPNSTVGNSGTLSLQATFGSTVSSNHAVKPRLILQRKVGSSSWKTVKKNISYNRYHQIFAFTPSYSTSARTADVRYRFASIKYKASKGRGVAHSTYSKSVKITYENQGYYTGLQQEAYSAVKPYCPGTAIHIKDLGNGGAEVGRYAQGALVLTLSPIVASYSTADKNTVALHECAHERQFINYGEKDNGTSDSYGTMLKAMNKYFINDASPDGTQPASYFWNAQEHAADCAALSVNPTVSTLGYGGYCNPSELSAGKRLLQGVKLT
jgi:hypothetical protein